MESIKLKSLFQQLPVQFRGVKEARITGICSDSRIVAPGNLFIAKQGSSYDGNQYISEAIQAGAAAVLTPLYNPFYQIPQLIHPNPAEIEASLAALYYRMPSKKLYTCGVTGTNGKTSSTYLIRHLLDFMGIKTGLVGTVETILGDKKIFSNLTTHDVISNQKFLREMLEDQCKAAVLEVSSHGLDQHRVDEIAFDVALFTNLTPDHLDYHGNLESYRKAKRRLFELLEASGKKNKLALANADDPHTAYLLNQMRVPHLLFGTHPQADLRAEAFDMSLKGISFTASYKQEKVRFFSPLIGRFNFYNLLGAIGVGIHRGWSLEEMLSPVAELQTAPGRLEKVELQKESDLHVYVDYAHTEDALHNVLQTLRELASARIITVFGAGGHRDKGRRKGLAKAAEKFSDLCMITSDNPRGEEPEEICREILDGFSSREGVRVEIDREKAIREAIAFAKQGDIVLIAGKGHEKTQIFAHRTIYFDDREVAMNALENR